MAEFDRFCSVNLRHQSFIESFTADLDVSYSYSSSYYYSNLQLTPSIPASLFKGLSSLGKEGIIASHPTFRIRYVDPDMAEQSQKLRMDEADDHTTSSELRN